MALVKSTLEVQILALLSDMYSRTENPEQAHADFANLLATAIDTYIKTATVIVNPGQGVQVAPITGTGSTITPGSGSLI